jgi:hypothetical protein
MNTELLLKYSMFAMCSLSVGVIVLIWRKRLLRDFGFLVALISVIGLEAGIMVSTLFFREELGIPKLLDYQVYFYSYWISYFVEYGLLLLVIYSVFRQAMKPMEGLQRAGKVVFRWVCGVSVALSVGLAIGPHMAGFNYIATAATQIEQGVSILTLCLLLFVCFSTRYLGLTYRSHLFGVSLGLGVVATGTLIECAWYSTKGAQSLYSPMYLFSSLGVCAALLTWGTYFAMPTPERKMILLPTTSPFFLWNRISEALGDHPGFVAVAGFKPDMLAPAELTVFTAASRRVREREAERVIAEREAEAAQQVVSMQSIAMPR